MIDWTTIHYEISKSIEPFESLPPIISISPVSSSFPTRMSVRPGEISEGGGWRVGPGMKWKERHWCEPAAAMELLKLGELSVSPTDAAFPNKPPWVSIGSNVAWADTPEEAIVLAYHAAIKK